MTRKAYLRKIANRRLLVDILMTGLGIASATLGLKAFLLPNDFIDGGVTGISLLVAALTDVGLPILIIAFNIPFILMGYFQMGKRFTVKTIAAICGLALALYFFNFEIITADKLLISVFGGFFLGLGIGLAMRSGCVIDGTEILALYLSKKTPLSIGAIILLINLVIFSFAAWLLGIEPALYSLLTYLVASRTIDFVVHGIEEFTGVTIISSKSEEIRTMITTQMGRGVTVYKAKGGYRREGDPEKEMEVLFTVITNLENTRLKTEVERIDPNAFLVMSTVNETKGGTLKRRRVI
ncbi:MAG: YitT family protein [Arcticibacter sp.]